MFEIIPGRTISHYKIIEKLGEGGMGEVYKARDTKLDRFVALKFLSSQITASEEDRARFIREAKAASAMNHPNVCTIYDIQDNNGQLFIVMEFVEGKTLKEKKDSISEKQIVGIGVQVAEGLAASHEKGIVHRDIKPENIMIRKDGIVQIMDFGLAKLRESSGVSRLTKEGTTMGTLGYMSPEQVEGQDVDYRTDIFSLGVVLYELLAGEPPFKGMYDTAIMYEIVNVDPPPISTIKESVNPQLDEIILECLEKDKDERCQSAKELAKNLRKLTAGKANRVYNVSSQSNLKNKQTAAAIPKTKTSLGEIQVKNLFRNIFYNIKLFWFTTAFLFIAVTLLLVFIVFNGTNTKVQEIKTSILPPPGINYNNAFGSNLTISPDGRYISFIGTDSSGVSKLWIRPINSLTARSLTTATNEAYPFWSPDSKNIAYFDEGKLMKISLGTGTSFPICDAKAGRGGTWNPKGIIVFAPDLSGGLYKVSSSGGTPEELVKPDTSIESLRWPWFLPNGNHFFYSTENITNGATTTEGIFISSLDNTKPRRLINVSSNCQYTSGYLLFVSHSILFAQEFAPDKLRLEGEAVPIAANIQYFLFRISGTFASSVNAKLIYLERNKQNNEKTVILDKNGVEIAKLADRKPILRACFSPDGNEIAMGLLDADGKNQDIWVYDLSRKVTRRLTFAESEQEFPSWMPGGDKITYSSDENGLIFNSFIKNADGSGNATLLCKLGVDEGVSDVSPDRNYFLLNALNYAGKSSGWDILLLSKKENIKPIKILSTNFIEDYAVFSPNMKWIAYQSDESGKFQIYVIPFNSKNKTHIGSGKWQISVDGGQDPKWMNNGKSIYFFTPNNEIMAVDVNAANSSLSPGKPYLIFKPGNINITGLYDINKNGTRIIATVAYNQSAQSSITLVENWQKEAAGRK